MSRIQRPLRPASVLSMMMMMVAERKDGGGGVCRAANGTLRITGFRSLVGRVGVLYRFVIYAVIQICQWTSLWILGRPEVPECLFMFTFFK